MADGFRTHPLALAIMFAIDVGAFDAEATSRSSWAVFAHYDDEVFGG